MITQKTLNQVNISDSTLARFQLNVASALNPVLLAQVLDGRLIQNLTIPASGKLVVPHGFGRPALGVQVVMASAATSVPYALSADQTAPNGSIVLTFTTGAGAVVSVWVF